MGIIFILMKQGFDLKTIIDYTQVTKEIISLCVLKDINAIVKSDKQRECEELILSTLPPNLQPKVSAMYFDEMIFLKKIMDNTIKENEVRSRNSLEVEPTNEGKEYVSRNLEKFIIGILKQERGPFADDLVSIFEEYVTGGNDSFVTVVKKFQLSGMDDRKDDLVDLASEYVGGKTVVKEFETSKMPEIKIGIKAATAITFLPKPAPNSSLLENLVDVEMLKEWTGFKSYDVVFESNTSDIDLFEFNGNVCGRNNLMLLVFSDDGSIFGSYTSVQVPQPSNWVKKDMGHFVFTIKNPYNVPPTRFYPTKPGNSVYIFQNDYMISVVAIQGAFKINIKMDSVYSTKFSKFYKDTVGKGASLFVTNPEKFTIKSIMALEFN